jgi:hypothetical protein
MSLQMKEIPLVTIENNEEKERVTIEVREREREKNCSIAFTIL